MKEAVKKTFARNDFVDIFRDIFTYDQIFRIEDLCREGTHLDYFSLFSTDDEFYILHRDTGILVSYYKTLGRCNSCNRSDFYSGDLTEFLGELKKDLDFNEWKEN